jgi:hypothetical protein
VAGIIGGAAGLNGSSAYVSAANAPSLQVTGSLSISGWVKFNARPAGFTEIIQKGSAYFLFADGNPYIGLAINGDYTSAANVSFPNSALGAWTYLAATYNRATSEVRIYCNGVLVSTRTTSNILTTGIEPLVLGAQSGGGGQFLNGAIDEFRIAETVLSSDRITTEYNNQSSPGTFYLAGSWAPIQTTVNAGSQTLVF